MVARYQSPPTWPPPPPGWTPTPGWAPDPAWGPAPEGWQFWVDDGTPEPARRPNRHAFRWSLLSILGWYLLVVLVNAVEVGSVDPEGAGRLFSSFLLGGLVAALAVRWLPVRIPVGLYPVLVIPFVLFFRLASVAGSA